MKAMLALEHNFLPASLHFETPNEAVDFNALNVHVAAEPIELLHCKQARLAGVNSFGFGGTNAHVIISDPQAEPEKVKPEASGKVFFASAHTASALEALLDSYRASLKVAAPPKGDRSSLPPAQTAHYLKHRFVAVGDDPELIVKAIEARSPQSEPQGSGSSRGRPRPGKDRICLLGQWIAVGGHGGRRVPARHSVPRPL